MRLKALFLRGPNLDRGPVFDNRSRCSHRNAGTQKRAAKRFHVSVGNAEEAATRRSPQARLAAVEVTPAHDSPCGESGPSPYKNAVRVLWLQWTDEPSPVRRSVHRRICAASLISVRPGYRLQTGLEPVPQTKVSHQPHGLRVPN